MADNKDNTQEATRVDTRAPAYVKAVVKANKLDHQLAVLTAMKEHGLSKPDAEVYAWATPLK